MCGRSPAAGVANAPDPFQKLHVAQRPTGADRLHEEQLVLGGCQMVNGTIFEMWVGARGSRRCYKDPRTPIFGALKNSFADRQMWSSLLSWSQDPTDDVVKVLVIGEILRRPFSQDVVRKLGLAITLEPATQQLVVTARCFGRVGF